MKCCRRWLPLAVLVAALLAAGGWGLAPRGSEAATVTINLTLTGDQEVPPVSSGTATATFQFDSATGMLSYTLTVHGVNPADVTAAHIHLGSPGVNGPVLHPLNISKSGGTSSGTVQLSPSDVNNLKLGTLYVNVHSTQYPNGFARAQLVLDAEAQIRARVGEIIDAFNRQDAAAFLDGFTDNGLLTTFGFSSRAEAEANIGEIFGGTISATVNSVQVHGSQATVDMTLNFGTYLEHDVDTWVLQGGVWRIDSTTIQPVPIPAGTKTVHVTLQEYAFVFDKSAIPADGNFAFDITNAGTMDHEVDLVMLPADMTVAQLLEIFQQEGPESAPPPGVEDVASAGPFSPGEHGTLVFTHPLQPGHYALLCFVPDANGVPHALLGMASEFTVGSGTPAGGAVSISGTSTGGITPPNTGDAGLKSDTANVGAGLLVLALLTASGGGATLLLSRRRSSVR